MPEQLLQPKATENGGYATDDTKEEHRKNTNVEYRCRRIDQFDDAVCHDKESEKPNEIKQQLR
ncbi:hypothetical protein FAZ15_03355 [Sphingobacterium olei]|uniref:Uncharacterized protein n=1 Tax=Sphingobacterium olei TaxID=2571155 RepID=A0A4V5MN43_9SPHI|nr:hypothetical protein [Sphingobacterium olei]TJZ63328.1 hypothetical protein FAZ15_03355 [Sphingobacterium olei]